MKVVETALPGVKIVEMDKHGDHRGYFMETYAADKLEKLGIDNVFVQDNVSFTQRKGTLRGIHFQNHPMAQAKLIRVAHGAVLDVAVDLRRGSPTYKKWVAVELSEDKPRLLLIPRGFGHGFLTLTDNVEFCYKVDNPYSPKNDRGIQFDDPELGIEWGCKTPILSDRDQKHPSLDNSDCNFTYSEEV